MLTKQDISTIVKYVHTCPSADCTKCQSRVFSEEQPFWLLDSGASSHFSYNIRDFIDYEKIDDNIVVKTASTPIYIKGKGAVLISHAIILQGKKWLHTTRLYPVYYIPQLTTRLLSLGEFLQQGLRIYGNAA